MRVCLRTCEGSCLNILFQGVQHVVDNHAEGMTVYSLCETAATPPVRRFVFANWDEESCRRLEVLASDFTASLE